MHSIRSIVLFFSIALAFVCAPGKGCDNDCISEGSWAVGVAVGSGQLSNPLFNADDKNLALIPSFYYYGQRLYIENTQIGYTLLENDNWSFDLHGQLNEDGLYFNEGSFDALLISDFLKPGVVDDPENETPFFPIDSNRVSRKYSYFAGGKLDYYYNDYLTFTAAIHQDVSGVTDGQTAGLGASLYFPINNWNFQAGVNFEYRSHKVNQYYYGLDEGEVSEYINGFTVGSGVNSGISLLASYIISKNMSFVARYSYKKFTTAIHPSPLLQKHQSALYFAGLNIQFGSE